jgi:hypothetical protein
MPTGLGRSAFERVDGLDLSSSHVTSVLTEKGGERLSNKPSSRGRSSIPLWHSQAPPQGHSRSSRRGFPPSRGPPSSRGQVGGDQDYRTKKANVPAAGLKCLPGHFPGFFVLVPGYMFGKLANGRTLYPPIVRPSSTLASIASLRADPGSHSRIFCVHVDSG